MHPGVRKQFAEAHLISYKQACSPAWINVMPQFKQIKQSYNIQYYQLLQWV